MEKEVGGDEEATKQVCIAQLLNRDRVGKKLACDLTLISGGREFQVHKNVLMLTCEYFEKMYTVEMKEKYLNVISMENIPPSRLSDIITFIYTGKIAITQEKVLDFVDDAEFLQFQTLKTCCTNFLLQAVSVDNCLKLQAYAERYNLLSVLVKCQLTILKNFASVMQSDAFLQLSFNEISSLLEERPNYEEEAMFEGIVKWVNFDICKRRTMFVELFSMLHFSLMTPDFFKVIADEPLVKENLKCANILINVILKKQSFPSIERILVIGGCNRMSYCHAYNVITRNTRQLPDLQTGRIGATVVRVKNKVYVMGGADTEALGKAYKTCEVLDTVLLGTWEDMPDMAKARKWPASIYAKGHIFVTGGWDKTDLPDCEKYSLANRKWERVAPLPRPKCGHGLVLCQDVLYCIGGFDFNEPVISCEYLDKDESKWEKIASLHQARSWFSCVELQGKIYAIGGRDDACKHMKTVERYTPETDTWEYVASLKVPRWRSSACVIGGRIYVVGGKSGSLALKSVEVYDSATDEWTLCFDVDEPVYAACAVSF